MKCNSIFLGLLLIFFSAGCPLFSQTEIRTNVCVVGAGSGGFGAALSALRAGVEVVVVEKREAVGGTSTLGYVNNWEPGVDCEYAIELYERLKKIPHSVSVTKPVHHYTPTEPYAILKIDSTLSYNTTLRRSDLVPPGGVVFDQEVMSRVMQQMLTESGRCSLMLHTSFEEAVVKGKKVEYIKVVNRMCDTIRIYADVFIDATGDLFLARAAGCSYRVGSDLKSEFGEMSATDTLSADLNAISLCYQIRRSNAPLIAPLPKEKFSYGFVAVSYDIPGHPELLSINPLGIMEGRFLIDHGYDSAYQRAKEVINHHWALLQTYPHFKEYEFHSYAPMLGIRESYRLDAEYILNQTDMLEGLTNQKQQDIIALADHPMDVHGRNSNLSRFSEPYGVPYRSLIPKGWDNLLVASRSAGFTQLAASSCRLSRTILGMGQAAGFAAAWASRHRIPVRLVPIKPIQAEVNLKVRPKYEPESIPKPIASSIGENKYTLLCSDNGAGKILRINSDGKIDWEYSTPECQDLHLLTNGNILFTYYTSKDGTVRGGVREITQEKTTVFNYEIDGEVHSCQRLKNGNTLLTDNNNARLIEVSPQGKEIRYVLLQTTAKGHSAIRMVRELDNGNYLVCQEEDKKVVEYTPEGKVINTFFSQGKCYEAIRLKNGNTVVSSGNVCSLQEFDSTGKEVWSFTPAECPELKPNWFAGLKELPDGRFLACNWLGHGRSSIGIPLFIVSKEKMVEWYFLDNVSTKSISNVSIVKN